MCTYNAFGGYSCVQETRENKSAVRSAEPRTTKFCPTCLKDHDVPDISDAQENFLAYDPTPSSTSTFHAGVPTQQRQQMQQMQQTQQKQRNEKSFEDHFNQNFDNKVIPDPSRCTVFMGKASGQC